MNHACTLAVALLCTACAPAPHAGDPVDSRAKASASAAPLDVESAAPTSSASPAPSEGTRAAMPLEVQQHTLDAKVKAVTPLGQRLGVHIVDADARFVIELELMGVAPAMADDPPGSALVAGKTVSFGVHSPAKLFKSADDMVGKRMRFSVTRTRTNTVVELGALQVE